MNTKRSATSTGTLISCARPLEIRIANTFREAELLRRQGFCPVECSFAESSSVDDLTMDHHGKLSNLSGVAIRAYNDHFGARRDDPRFVVTGFPDEDAAFAIASLAGILPHASWADRIPRGYSQPLRNIVIRNLSHVATEINRVDVNPDQAISLVDSYWGRLILAWRQRAHPTACDNVAWYGAVDRWRTMLTSALDDWNETAIENLDDLRKQVMNAQILFRSDRVVVADLSAFGRNSVFYQEWLKVAPILVAYVGGGSEGGTCSFVVRDVATAKALLGPTGLSGIYEELSPKDCGGRNIIGGSSRSQLFPPSVATDYGMQIDSIVDRLKIKPSKRRKVLAN